MSLGWVRTVSIAFSARRNRPAKLDCPEPFLMAFSTDRARLFCPSGSNLGAGTCNNGDSAGERHRNIQISLFCKKPTPADFRLKPKASPSSSRAKQLPNGAPGLQIRRPLGQTSEPSGGRFTFPPTPLPAGHPPDQIMKNPRKHKRIQRTLVLLHPQRQPQPLWEHFLTLLCLGWRP